MAFCVLTLCQGEKGEAERRGEGDKWAFNQQETV